MVIYSQPPQPRLGTYVFYCFSCFTTQEVRAMEGHEPRNQKCLKCGNEMDIGAVVPFDPDEEIDAT